MYNLYFLIGYNNYYNRKLKREYTIQEYKTAVGNKYIELDNCLNFNPADGVASQHVLNDLKNLNVISEQPNYLVVCDKNNNILQRWFVIDCDRTRGGQYICTLYRDVLIDAYDAWIQAPVFVEKAILDPSDPAIFNHEQMTFSQIKKDADSLITDDTGIPWIVGYGNFKNIEDVTSWGAGSSTIPTSAITVDINTLRQNYRDPIVQATSYRDIYLETALVNSSDDKVTFSFTGSKTNYTTTALNAEEWDELAATSYKCLVPPGDGGDGGDLVSNITRKFKAAIEGAGGFDNEFNSLKLSKQTEVNNCLSINNKYYKDATTGVYYKGTVKIESNSSRQRLFSNSYPTLYSTIRTVPDGIAGLVLNPQNDRSNAYYFDIVNTKYTVTFEELGKAGGKVDFRNAKELNDAPYSMFFMPYGDTYLKRGTDFTVWGNKTANLMAATGIAQALKSSGFIYDIQILPYCPVQEFVYHNRNWCVDGNKYDVRSITDDNDNVLTSIVFAEGSSGSFITSLIIDDPYGYNKKLEYETKLYRLCDPNQNAIFDFSPTMNSDYVEFECQFTYKPYKPYIHINPKFDGMYGLNQPQDQRGLICGGDFSIDMVNDQWATYQLNNINYEKAFNRQIESFELSQDMSRLQDKVGMITGAIGAAGTGAAMGSAWGAGGAAIGGMAAGAASVYAGRTDMDINDKLRNDALDLKNDMFGYTMGNIQARPLTLSKLSGFNTNSRYMPYLEVYSCTDDEYEALKRKIEFNGETVMRIDYPRNFMNNKFYTSTYQYNKENYFKGKLIRLELDGEDYHFVNTIADELNKGVYIPLGGV